MKKYLSILLVNLMCVLCTSCITSSYAETDIGDEQVQVVIQYGTPCYYGSTLAYYIYDGYYFYPYRYNNSWRFHRYARPLPPPRHHYNNGHRYFGKYSQPPSHHGISRPSRSSHHDRPMKNSTRTHFGGKK